MAKRQLEVSEEDCIISQPRSSFLRQSEIMQSTFRHVPNTEMVTLAAVRISKPTQRLYKMLNSKKGTGEMQYVQSYHNDVSSGGQDNIMLDTKEHEIIIIISCYPLS